MRKRGEASADGRQLEGQYANWFKVGFNAYEFVIDFGQYYQENDEEKLCIRIVTSPAYAKRFLKVFEKSIEEYQAKYGIIPEE